MLTSMEMTTQERRFADCAKERSIANINYSRSRAEPMVRSSEGGHAVPAVDRMRLRESR